MTTKLLANPGNLAQTLPPSSKSNYGPLPLPSKFFNSQSQSPPQILCSCNRFLRPLRASPVHDDDKPPPLSLSPSPPSSSSSTTTTTTMTTNDDDDESILKQQQEEEAREAISEILQEFGASKEDSVDIALRSPKYLAMLIDSVRDLDDISLWNPWTRKKKKEQSIGIGCQQQQQQQQQQLRPEENEEEEQDPHPLPPPPVSLKEKVYYMAKEKGDKGMLPFLESLGLTLPSATLLARYLSAHTLPHLIHKVKYVKAMFFSNSDDEVCIGKKAREMMMNLSIPIDEDVQQTLSFFEKIEARRGGLDMLGSGDASFRYLIESFPRILLLSLESHMKPMVKFLEDIGVPRGCTRNILILFPPIIFYNIENDIKLRIQAFEKVSAGNKDFGRLLLKYPWILSTGIQENYKEIISFFVMEKVPKVCVDLAIKSWPLLLGCSIRKLKMMVGQFGELGIRNKKLCQVIATSPQLLLRKPQEFLQVVVFLRDLGLDEEAIGGVLGRCPQIFASSMDKTLKKKLDFLTTIGVSKGHLCRVIRKYPELFVCDVERTLVPRLKYLMKTGLSNRDIAFMVNGFSPLLGYSIEQVLRPKLEFLVNTMGKPLKDVVDYPRYFSYSLERKIKPRYWVLKGRNVECSLKDMLGKNDEEFAADYMGFGRMLVDTTDVREKCHLKDG
ncbi:Transcription termination factor like [Actinidia chinensis var. chinensis]|uniref:Transcription termination factor like n=1 Tax=Actinidia chinensis var. chinensis TaxID=1590841 RepID=A0A2R6QF36_ACTCC|nr:Transcription termination factor like [Actinidia chinensis var. chinensis]